MYDEELVVVAEYGSAVEAEMARNILACAGIESYVNGEYMTTIYPGVIRSRLLVSTDKYKQAKILLRIRE